MKCPACAAAELVPDKRDVCFSYKGHTSIIPAVTGHFCPVCGESVPGQVEGDRISAVMLAFKREIDELGTD